MAHFISHDTADNNGVRAEVSVDTGTGFITAIEEAGSRNRKVVFRSTHTELRHPVYGYLGTNDPLLAVCQKAMDEHREIAYRTESQRRNAVDRKKPHAECEGTSELTRILAAIDGGRSLEWVTNPDRDPVQGRRPDMGDQPVHGPAGGAAVSSESALAALTVARQAGFEPDVVAALVAAALLAGAEPQSVKDAGVKAQGQSPDGGRSSLVATEKAPFFLRNSDGRLNLGSHAVGAALGAEKHARGLVQAHTDAMRKTEGNEGPYPPLTDEETSKFAKKALGLARVLLGLADEVQVAAYGAGRPDRNAESHARARSLVYAEIENLPVPFDTPQDSQRAWGAMIVEHAGERFRVVSALAEVSPAGAPAQAAPAQATPKAAPPKAAPAPAPAAPKAAPAPAPAAAAPAAPTAPAPAAAAAPAQPSPAAAPSVPENPTELLRKLADVAGMLSAENLPKVTAVLQAEFGVNIAAEVLPEVLMEWVQGYRVPGGPARFAADAEAAFAESGSADPV